MIEFIKNQAINTGNESAKIFVTGDVTEETVVELNKDIELCKNSGIKQITFCINSPGGSVSDGMALYDLVVALSDIETIAEIQGLCASAATYLPLACDTIRINKNADMMLHEPEGGFYGTLKQAEADVEYFSTLRDRIIALYASRTGKSPADIETLLDEARFLNAKECLELHLVDEVIGEDEEPTEDDNQEQPEDQEEIKDDGSTVDEGSNDEEQEKVEDKVDKPSNFFSFENIVSFLKKNNISMIKASDDEFAQQEEIVNSLTTKVKDLETALEAKEKSYNEIVNRLEESSKDFDKKLQVAVANKIASFGYENTSIPAPEKAQKMSQSEFHNMVKEIYTSKGYQAASDFVKKYEQGM